MKSLTIVQKIAKVLGILAKIGYIFCIIGAAGSFAGGIVLVARPYMSDEVAKMFMSEIEIANVTELGISLIAVSVFLVGQVVAAWFVCRYFKNELADGTPFTHRGAQDLLRTGIINLAVPFGTMCLATAIAAIGGIDEQALSIEYEAMTGIIMILVSFVLHYGADLEDGKATEE